MAWRDGVPFGSAIGPDGIPGEQLLPGGAHFLPLERAVDHYRHVRDGGFFEESDDLLADWFPVASYENADLIWVDCRGDPSGPAPLILWYASDYNDPEALRARTAPAAWTMKA